MWTNASGASSGSVSPGANPGTDSQFPANRAGNLVSVPGLRRIAAPAAGRISFPGAILPNRRRTLLSALFIGCTFAHAQTITFELQSSLDSPIALVNFTPGMLRTQSDRRQFLTVKNESDKVTAAVVFQQTISGGPRTEIVTLERVSIIIRPREKKRLSVSVRDVWNQLQTAVKGGETTGKPVLSVAVVEFIDGSSWSAPVDRASAQR
jgi:hypothetical protein